MMFQRIKDAAASRTGILCIAVLTAVCSVLPAWGMLVSADDTSEITLGDLNGDHSVDAADAAKLLIAAAAVGTGNPSGLTETQEAAADLNGDAAFDAVDASQILNYAAYVGSGGTASLESFLHGEHIEPSTETTAATVATQPAVDESGSITRDGYYGHAWSFWNSGEYLAYCWTSSSHIVAYDFIHNKVVIDYELSGQEYTDFMYVYNNEVACGNQKADAVSKAFKYINNIKSLGRDRVLYTNDIEDDGICSSVWSVWITSDGEYWWTA